MAVVLRFNRPAGQKRRNGLRPVAVRIGIIVGSAVAMTASLTMSPMVFLLLPEYWARLAPERLSLLKGLASSCSLAAIGGMSFVGELRHWRWRYGAQIVLAAMLIALGIIDRP